MYILYAEKVEGRLWLLGGVADLLGVSAWVGRASRMLLPVHPAPESFNSSGC